MFADISPGYLTVHCTCATAIHSQVLLLNNLAGTRYQVGQQELHPDSKKTYKYGLHCAKIPLRHGILTWPTQNTSFEHSVDQNHTKRETSSTEKCSNNSFNYYDQYFPSEYHIQWTICKYCVKQWPEHQHSRW